MTVIKRDGTTVEFDRSKIIIALSKANDAVEENERISEEQMEEIADFITDKKAVEANASTAFLLTVLPSSWEREQRSPQNIPR